MSKQKKIIEINSPFTSIKTTIVYSDLSHIKKELSIHLTDENFKLIDNMINNFLEILKSTRRNKFTKEEFRLYEELTIYRIYFIIYNRIRIDYFLKDKNIKSKILSNKKSKEDFYNSYLTTFLNDIFFLPGMVYYIMDAADRKYDIKVFIKANKIKEEFSKKRLTYEQSLMEAIKYFDEYRDLENDSLEFYNLNISYRRFRSQLHK